MSIWRSAKKALEHPPMARDVLGGAAHIGWADIIKPTSHHVIHPILSEVFDTTHPKEWTGDFKYYLAKYGPEDAGINTVKDKDIINAHEHGYNGKTGGRAVWELMQHKQPKLARGVADMLIDPLTYVGGGSLLEKAGKGTAEIGAKATEYGTAKLAKSAAEEAAKQPKDWGAILDQYNNLPQDENFSTLDDEFKKLAESHGLTTDEMTKGMVDHLKKPMPVSPVTQTLGMPKSLSDLGMSSGYFKSHIEAYLKLGKSVDEAISIMAQDFLVPEHDIVQAYDYAYHNVPANFPTTALQKAYDAGSPIIKIADTGIPAIDDAITQVAKSGGVNTPIVAGKILGATGRGLSLAGKPAAKLGELQNRAVNKIGAETVGRFAKTRPGQWITTLSPREQIREQLDRLEPAWKHFRESRVAMIEHSQHPEFQGMDQSMAEGFAAGTQNAFKGEMAPPVPVDVKRGTFGDWNYSDADATNPLNLTENEAKAVQIYGGGGVGGADYQNLGEVARDLEHPDYHLTYEGMDLARKMWDEAGRPNIGKMVPQEIEERSGRTGTNMVDFITKDRKSHSLEVNPEDLLGKTIYHAKTSDGRDVWYTGQAFSFKKPNNMVPENSKDALEAWGKKEIKKTVNKAVEKSTIEHDMDLFSGLPTNNKNTLIGKKVGDTWADPGLRSSSRKKSIAEVFSGRRGAGKSAVLEIKVKAGARGLWVPHWANADEEEVLFSTGYKWKITDIQHGKDYTTYVVEPADKRRFLGKIARPHQYIDPSVEKVVNRMVGGMPVVDRNIGTRTFERGPHAGKTATEAISSLGTYTNAHGMPILSTKSIDDDQKFFLDNGISWKPGATEQDIVKKLRTIKGDVGDQARQVYEKYRGSGLDPLNGDRNALLGHRVRSVIQSDPTIPGLGPDVNASLFDTTTGIGEHKGKTTAQTLLDLEQKVVDDRRKVVEAVGENFWKFGDKRAVIEKNLEKEKGALKIFKDYFNEGIDILHSPTDDAAFHLFKKIKYAEAGVAEPRSSGMWNDISKLWKGTALLSPRYHTSNIFSSWLNTLIVNGTKGMASPGDFWKQALVSLRAVRDPELRDALEISNIKQGFDEWGSKYFNTNLGHAGMATTLSGIETVGERVFKKLFLGSELGASMGRKVGRVLEYNRAIGVGIDTTSRYTLAYAKFDSEMGQELPKIERKIMDTFEKSDVTLNPDVALMPFKDPQYLYGYWKGLGLEDGVAKRLSQDVAEARNKAIDAGIKMVQKAHFSYYRTNLDELVSKIVPFHYYASRASILYTEAMMRNPVLMVNFARMMQELNSGYENSGLDARQKGYMKILGGPAGYTLLANPDALLGFSKAIGLASGTGYKGDQTKLGGVLTFMKSMGYGLYPWVDGMFNMVGTYGDTFEPDMLGIRHRALVGSLVNELSAEINGDGQMSAAPYAKANAIMRAEVSAAASKFLPGWMSTPVEVKANDSGTIAESTYEKAVESRIIRDNPGLTYQQLFDIMNNPDSKELGDAEKEVTRSGLASQLLGFIMPTSMKLRDSSQDVRSAQIGTTYDFANKLGIPADQVTPAKDAEFATKYRLTTGSDWKPTDFDKALTENMLATATPRSRGFLLKLSQYDSLGTKLGQDTLHQYNHIKFGEVVPSGFTKPLPGQEEATAQLWLSKQGRAAQLAMKEVQNMQALFKQTNPDFAAYKDWQGQVFHLKTLFGGSLAYYREQVSKINAGAKLYFDQVSRQLRKKYTDPVKYFAAMDDATTSPDAYLAINGIGKTESTQMPGMGMKVGAMTGATPDATQQLLGQFDSSGQSSSSSSSQKTHYTDFLQRF